MPPGSARHLSWLFAARDAKPALLGVYALMAEWRALASPGTETAVAQIKLAWWREEIGRLAAGAPLHPITRHLAVLPGAPGVDWAPLGVTVDATAAQMAGVPLERGLDLAAHAEALLGAPLQIAARLVAAPACDGPAVRTCIAELSAAQYLVEAVADYRRHALAGQVMFPVDDLLAAGIGNDDLAAAASPPRLGAYLGRLQTRADMHFAAARDALDPAQRPPLRHLLVLAVLGARRVRGGARRADADFGVADLYNAWSAARRAAAGR